MFELVQVKKQVFCYIFFFLYLTILNISLLKLKAKNFTISHVKIHIFSLDSDTFFVKVLRIWKGSKQLLGILIFRLLRPGNELKSTH